MMMRLHIEAFFVALYSLTRDLLIRALIFKEGKGLMNFPTENCLLSSLQGQSHDLPRLPPLPQLF